MKFEFKRLVQPNSCCNAIVQIQEVKALMVARIRRHKDITRYIGWQACLKGTCVFILGVEIIMYKLETVEKIDQLYLPFLF